MVEYNIDPETCSKEELLSLINELELKSEAYDANQNAVKRFINSIYGAISSPFFAQYNVDIGESITLQGQHLNKYSTKIVDLYINNFHTLTDVHQKIADKMKEEFPDFDAETFLTKAKEPIEIPFYNSTLKTKTATIGGDTDSIYVSFQPLIKSCGISLDQASKFIMFMYEISIKDYLKTKYDEYAKYFNCDTNIEELELEKVARTVIYMAKKNYIMDIAWKEPDIFLEANHKLNIKGYDTVKGSTPKFCRECMLDFAKWMMEYLNADKKPGYPEIISKLKVYKQKFTMQNPDDICKILSLTDYEKYVYDDRGKEIKYMEGVKTIPWNVKAASIYNNMLQTTAKKYKNKYNLIKKGDKISLYYVNENDAFGYITGDFPLEFAPKLDIDTNFDKQILTPLNRILVACGYQEISPNLVYNKSLW